MEQLRSMWLNGQIAATDQLMQQGATQWYSASTVMAVAAAEEPPPKKKSVGCLGWAAAVLAGLLVFAIMGQMVGGGSSGTDTFTGSSSIKRWVKNNMADPDARVVAVSQVMTVGGAQWKKARIAAKNALGGPIMQDRIFEMDGSAVSADWTVEQFAAWVESEAKEMPAERAVKLRKDAAEFARATLYAQ